MGTVRPTIGASRNADDPANKFTEMVRVVAVGASAAAMILVPTVGPVVAGTEEGASEFDSEITPPDYAFVIWGPIFLATAANALQHAADPTAPINRSTGWWLAGAYGANAAWSVAAQTNRFRYTPFILSVAAALAGNGYRRAQTVDARGARKLVPISSGLLFGWTSVAAVVNAFSVGRNGNPVTSTRTGRNAARLAVAGAASALTAVVTASTRGYTSVAVAGTWALATSSTDRRRTIGTRLISGTAAAALAATTTVKLWRCRARARHPAAAQLRQFP
ncbi:MAG: hypothetical protein ABWZ02_01465 [Nakamurella sp.]